MRIFIYDTYTDLNTFFNLPSDNLPILGSTLSKFMQDAFERQASLHNDSVTFHRNVEYTEHLSEDYEIVLLTSVFSVPVGNISREEIAFLKQNPDKMFQNNGVIGGYIKKPETPTQESNIFVNFWELNLDNFLYTNQVLLPQLSLLSPHQTNDSITRYGNPIILSQNVVNSTICYPCFIDKDVHVSNSYIGAGTILLGNTSVSNSRVYSSFVQDTRLSDVKAEDIIASYSVLEGGRMSKSLFPFGSKVYTNNDR